MFLPLFYYWIYPSFVSIVMGVAVAAPLISFLGRLGWRWDECPLTIAENRLREKMGLPRIRGWIGHYFIRPIRRFLRSRTGRSS